ncbi:leucyl-tRNA synthetase [Xylariomycetidae sp. FL0641]|nr:leucyl-tRNA synthetase [Xylariomycetidae sp. FL0641]
MYSSIRNLGRPLGPPCLRLPFGGPRHLLRASRRWQTTHQLNLSLLDNVWRPKWEAWRRAYDRRMGALSPSQATGNSKMYILPMFPYPSGNLHLGHLRVYTIADVVARFRRLQGHHVLLPIGWDAFGLPAENAANEHGVEPAVWTSENIARMKSQLEDMNASFDWRVELATNDPKYYEQTQRIFLLLHKHNLVYRDDHIVNYDPVEETVLANEQVDSEGRAWRSGAKVEQKRLTQWFFHTTAFKRDLLQDLQTLGEGDAWPEHVLSMQRNWIGYKKAAYYKFPTNNKGSALLRTLEVMTTRPETVFAVQYIAISPKSPALEHLKSSDPELRKFLERIEDLSPDSVEGYRLPSLEAYIPVFWPRQLDPVPVYVAAYVRDYEKAMVMGVPAHDPRDFKFWKHHQPDAAIKHAVTPDPSGAVPEPVDRPFYETGYMTGIAGKFRQKRSDTVGWDIVQDIRSRASLASAVEKWQLRDWLISRQRYWGTPIPVIHCQACGPQPVPEDQLPVELPPAKFNSRGEIHPLSRHHEWKKTTCPKCHGPAERETDTMDTFVDSSWYYMRYADPKNKKLPISEAAAKAYLPVDLYIGGVEHAILHLLYARFIYKAVMGILFGKSEDETLRKITREPFKRLVTQGMVHGKTYSDPETGRFLKPEEVDISNPAGPQIIKSGVLATVTYEKMSKSKHNGVDPGEFIGKYGADATRAHILFQAPVSEVLNWDEDKIAGVLRWLRRVYNLVQSVSGPHVGVTPDSRFMPGKAYFNRGDVKMPGKEAAAEYAADIRVWRKTQEAIIAVTEAYEKVYSLNIAVSTLMGLTNAIVENPQAAKLVRTTATKHLIKLMAPITPAVAEECHSMLEPRSHGGIFHCFESRTSWPMPDGSLELLIPKQRTCTVQVNGRVRCTVEIPVVPESIKGEGEYQTWITDEILKTEEGGSKLGADKYDIRAAKKMFVVRDGALVNYIL